MEEEAARRKLVLGGEVDHISTLPDDLLLQILFLIPCTRGICRGGGCFRVASTTSCLSTRWRGLLARLPRLTFHDIPLEQVVDAIHRRIGRAPPAADPPVRRSTRRCVLSRRPAPSSAVAVAKLNPPVPPPVPLVPHLVICVPRLPSESQSAVRSLLDAAAMLGPVDLRFSVDIPIDYDPVFQVNVPRFPHATSIELQGLDLVFNESLQSGLGFPKLERLVLSGCRAILSSWVHRSPRLLLLRVSNVNSCDSKIIILRSNSLQELNVEAKIPSLTDNVDIVAPALKQLTMSFGTGGRYHKMLVSVYAPMLEKVSWKCTYSTAAAGLGRWGLLDVGLKPVPVETNGQGQLPHIHALSLSANTHSSYRFSGAAEELIFGAEIKKHMVINFSMLELRISTSGHVYGAFALRILGMDLIRTVIKSLKIVLLRSKSKEACPENCPCEEPKDWRTQSIYLPKLEEVEIRGEDHEFDFWELVISRAPNLKSVVMDRPSNKVKSDSWRVKIIDIVKAKFKLA